ncbi:MAG: CrcB family protein [Verrucomicrobia bacterium]|nr:CrcB family protein [Verrucomicrobiota bacterium]
MEYLYVGLGSAAGGLLRFWLAALVTARTGEAIWGILLINVTGSFCLGLLFGLLGEAAPRSPLVPLLGTGVLGGYTTFSTFSYQALQLLQQDRGGTAAIYVGVSVLGGLAAAWAGYLAGRALG